MSVVSCRWRIRPEVVDFMCGEVVYATIYSQSDLYAMLLQNDQKKTGDAGDLVKSPDGGLLDRWTWDEAQ